MTRRAQVWLVVAALFLVANVGAAGFAATYGEVPHTGIHVLLAIVGACLVWRLAARRGARPVGHREDAHDADVPSVPADLTDRLTYIEQSVEAVAIEVERIGEGQRFVTRIFAERGAPPTPDRGGARTETGAHESASGVRRS